MALTKAESKKILKAKVKEIEDAINSIEEELLKTDEEFKKHILGFHFGRLQQQFLGIHALLKDNEWI